MSELWRLPTMAEWEAQRPRACPKGLPTPLLKKEKKATKEAKHKAFRLGVWERDRGLSRASRKPLARSGSDYDRVGEVHHVLARSTHPDQIFEVSNGILLSRTEHVLAETACPGDPSHCLLDITGPADRGQPQIFVWRDKDGKEVKRRIG